MNPTTRRNAYQRTASLYGLLILFAACGGQGTSVGPSEGAGGTGAVSGSPAPEFELEAVSGGQVRRSDSAGKVMLVDFWATWCAPCREEIPMFKELHETYGPEGFTIVAISDESTDVIREFVGDNDIPYTNLSDNDGEVTELYGVLALPSAYLIDREGNIAEVFMGPKPRKVLERKIQELLAQTPAT